MNINKSAIIIFNKKKVIYIPEGYNSDPNWNNLNVRVVHDLNNENVIQFEDDFHNILFCINEIDKIEVIKRKNIRHFISWGNNFILNKRQINIDASDLNLVQNIIN